MKKAWYGLLGILVLGAGVAIWANSWEYRAVEGIPVSRTNRITGAVQFRGENGWYTPGPAPTPAPSPKPGRPTYAQVAKLDIDSESTEYSDGVASGQIYNGGEEDIIGEVVAHVELRRKGQKVKYRRIRETVHWPAQRVSKFSIKAGIALTVPDTWDIHFDTLDRSKPRNVPKVGECFPLSENEYEIPVEIPGKPETKKVTISFDKAPSDADIQDALAFFRKHPEEQ